MRTRLVAAALLALVAAAPVAAQDAKQDRAKALEYLEDTRARFLKSVYGLTEAQWRFKAGPDRWSIAEVAEHIALSESLILGMIEGQVLKAPAKKPGEGITDEKLMAGIIDRSQKAQAPEVLKPTNKWPTREALVKDFNAARDKTIAWTKTTTEDLRAHAAPHPAFGPLDAHQWILLVAGHSARHTLQIEAVKTAAGYPK
jgi:DinB family protein